VGRHLGHSRPGRRDLSSEEALNAPLHEIEQMLRTQGGALLRATMQAHFDARSAHQVTCRSEGVALWCDVESRGANPGRRQNIPFTSDARACGLPIE
jgi:hypothetical protein